MPRARGGGKALFTMNRHYAFCIAIDAGNRSMRKGWPRTAWNDEDHRAALRAQDRCRALHHAYPWATPEQVEQMRRELGWDTLAESEGAHG